MYGAGGRCADLVWHRLPLGEREDSLLPQPPGQLRAPPPRAILRRRDNDDAPAGNIDERRPRERARAGGRVRDLRRAGVFEPLGELAESVASVGEREDATEARGRSERGRA